MLCHQVSNRIRCFFSEYTIDYQNRIKSNISYTFRYGDPQLINFGNPHHYIMGLHVS